MKHVYKNITLLCKCVMIVLFLVFNLNCNRNKSCRSEPNDQDTPEAVLFKIYNSILINDKKGFIECFSRLEDYLKLTEGMFEIGRASIDFKDALINHYGENAWEEHRKIISDDKAMAILWTPPNDISYFVDQIKITVKGDTAFFVNPTEDLIEIESKLVNENGVWRWDLSYRIEDPEMGLKLQRKCLNGIKETTKDIGKPGISITDLKVKLFERCFD